ncbi:predicted protein [Naegleria gruberi]|uniref:Predicted protein n=1 Tax=Naegleria gruberi TaxID=5762 RepID=D2VGH3_NAEGR|nr:uncharacterized protein NAEGRDRAFT_49343 [Naegleria gruberi]EFC44064.1 predicted protein [Naegleria gruberi]|eukprot:XP_002676808.1 predicted protein [Naegleria gruberi strain NEG-M]
MTEIIYFGDYQMFRKLKELYNVSSNSSNNSEKKLMKRKKKTCLENISFMFKENHFQFPPRLNNNNANYHGSKSQFGTNVLFEKLKVFKNVIGVLTWNGDEFFPSQTLTLFDLNRSDSIVHVLELSEDEMINERIIDFQLGDDFVICQTESTQLYFIGLYSNQSSNSNNRRADIKYYCRPLPCQKMGQIEWVKCGLKTILIKTLSQNFYVADVEKLNSTPNPKPVDHLFKYPDIFDGVIGEDFVGFIGVAPTGSHSIDNNCVHLFLNKEKLLADNHTLLFKENNKHYLSNGWGCVSDAIDNAIYRSFPEETVTIKNIIGNPSVYLIRNVVLNYYIGNNSKLDTYMTCPHRYYLSYLDKEVKGKPTVPIIRGSSLHESLAHFSKLYNLVYQEIEKVEEESGLFLTEANHKAKLAYSHYRPAKGVDLEVDFAKNIGYNKIIASEIVKKIKNDVELNRILQQSNELIDGTNRTENPEFLDFITERAVKTFNRHVVGSAKAESIYVPKDVVQESKEMLRNQIKRELTNILLPPSSLFQSHSAAQHFGMNGNRRPVLIEESFVLTGVGGSSDVDLVVIFDRVDIEKDENDQSKYVVVEYKSSIKPKYLSGFEKQLSIYHYAFQQLFGETISKSNLTCLTTGEVYSFTDDKFDHSATENMILEYATKSMLSIF